MKLVICLILSSMVQLAYANQTEADYVQANCTGTIEFMLPDRTRIDCLTDDVAEEFDFGVKWAEAIGQSLHYASMTGKRAGIAIIIRDKADLRGYNRVRSVINHYNLPITLRIIQ